MFALISNNLYTYIYFFFFKKRETKTIFYKLNLSFSNSFGKNIIKPVFSNNTFFFIFTSKLTKLISILQNIFCLNKNVLFIDYDFNFNYLPILNSDLFSRSSYILNKYVKFFDIGAILFLNLKKKKFIFKKLFSKKTINVSVGYNTHPSKFDLSLTLPQNRVTHYLLYLFVMNVYISVKNKNLNINGSAFFFL